MPDDVALRLLPLHLRWGWWGLFIFSSLGLLLESLHAFKVGWYLDAGQDTRRLMFTLGHAHGTLLALVHFGMVATITRRPYVPIDASWALRGASVLVPVGFLAGGLVIHEGDPNVAILLAPLGGLALVWSCARLALDRGDGDR